MKELTKRIITSLFLIILLILAFSYSYLLITSLIVVSTLAWIEINGLITKIFKNYNIISNIFIIFLKFLSLLYITLFSFLIFSGISQDEFNLNMIYLISICICSDIGGYVFGKIFKGKKLTKISPNKTISGAIGSFLLPLSIVPFFYYVLNEKLFIFSNLLIIAILVSFFCQLGDLFISYLKRKANVKDTGDILPGHGGILDRIDGILLAIPSGIIIWKFLITNL